MPMTIVRPGDDRESVAARLAAEGSILIDPVVVDAYASVGVSAAALRDAIRSHRPHLLRKGSPVAVPGGSPLELHGRLEAGTFRLDRLAVGRVTYFATREETLAHVADYSRMDGPPVGHAAAGRRLADVLPDAAFRSARSPRIMAAEHRVGDALRLHVERTSVAI